MNEEQRKVLAHVVADPDFWWAECQAFARQRYELDAPARAAGRPVVAALEAAAADAQAAVDAARAAVKPAYDSGDPAAAVAAEAKLRQAGLELARALQALGREAPRQEALERLPDERAARMLAEKVANWQGEHDKRRAQFGKDYKTRAEREPEALAAVRAHQASRARRAANPRFPDKKSK